MKSEEIINEWKEGNRTYKEWGCGCVEIIGENGGYTLDFCNRHYIDNTPRDTNDRQR